jgi:hypothetical protein
VVANFEESLSEFREFLRKNDYPEKVIWVEPEDILLSGHRFLYVRAPVPEINEQHVRQLYDVSQGNKTGILFETICAVKDATYAFAWMPRDATEAEYRLMGDSLKMSAKAGLGKVLGKVVHSRLCWRYLQWTLRRKQQNKNLLFC